MDSNAIVIEKFYFTFSGYMNIWKISFEVIFSISIMAVIVFVIYKSSVLSERVKKPFYYALWLYGGSNLHLGVLFVLYIVALVLVFVIVSFFYHSSRIPKVVNKTRVSIYSIGNINSRKSICEGIFFKPIRYPKYTNLLCGDNATNKFLYYMDSLCYEYGAILFRNNSDTITIINDSLLCSNLRSYENNYIENLEMKIEDYGYKTIYGKVLHISNIFIIDSIACFPNIYKLSIIDTLCHASIDFFACSFSVHERKKGFTKELFFPIKYAPHCHMYYILK